MATAAWGNTHVKNNFAAVDALIDLQGGTFTDGGILLGSGTGTFTAMAVLADGSIVVGDGTTDPVALAAFTSSTGLLKHESGGLEFNASAITTGGLLMGDSSGVMVILAAGSNGQFIKLVSGKPAWATGSQDVATGEYTGDGATSQAITGVGFQVKDLWISVKEVLDGQNANIFVTNDSMVNDNAAGMCIEYTDTTMRSRISGIITLGADGFTVDDAGADEHPNKNTIVYVYRAIG